MGEDSSYRYIRLFDETHDTLQLGYPSKLGLHRYSALLSALRVRLVFVIVVYSLDIVQHPLVALSFGLSRKTNIYRF